MTGPAGAGAVLTGGASSRMGRDKALLPLGGGVLAERSVQALLGAGLAPVVCVGGDVDGLRGAGLTPIVDLYPGDGPLGGIISALTHLSDHEIVVILAGDLMTPTPSAVRETIGALVRTRADLAVATAEGRAQWLHGAWRTATALPTLSGAFASGERAVHRAVAGLSIIEVTGLDHTALLDVDTPADLGVADP